MKLRGVGDPGQYPGAKRLGKLYGGKPDTARCAENQHGFAGLIAAPLTQRKPGGIVYQRHGRRFFERHRIGDGMALVCRHRDQFGKAAARLAHGDDPVAGRETLNPVAQRADNAGGTLTWNEGQGGARLMQPADQQDVDIIRRGGVDFDQNFARPRHRIRHVANDCLLKRAERIDDDSTHCFFLPVPANAARATGWRPVPHPRP